MKPDVEKRFRIAEESLRELENLMVGGFYRDVAGRSYFAMLNVAAAALLAKEIKTSERQVIIAEFDEAFVKTGLLDKKYLQYFSQALSARSESDVSVFPSIDHREAQTMLLRVKVLSPPVSPSVNKQHKQTRAKVLTACALITCAL